MPQVDNMMLVKSVQLLRRLGPDSVEGVFCNLSTQSLLDSEFYPELIEFMEENSGLSDSLFFEFAEKALLALSPNGLENLNALGRLGFRFSLNHVADLDIDYAGLRDNYFRFVKIPASLLDGMDEAGISARQLKRELEAFGLTLVVERLEDASSLDRLKDFGVELAQGHGLAAPKPFGSDLLARPGRNERGLSELRPRRFKSYLSCSGAISRWGIRAGLPQARYRRCRISAEPPRAPARPSLRTRRHLVGRSSSSIAVPSSTTGMAIGAMRSSGTGEAAFATPAAR